MDEMKRTEQLSEGNLSRIEKLARFLKSSQRPVFLTGAGMSTESGIPDFRSSAGLYSSGVTEKIFDISEFRSNPQRFYTFARSFFAQMFNSEPNPGHFAVSKLQQTEAKEVHVITQNIDLLHEKAGTANVYTVHGTIETSSCMTCGAKCKTSELWQRIQAGKIPIHECGGLFKPDIVFFGEMLPVDALQKGENAVREADLLIVAGTSLSVYPAAGLPNYRKNGCKLVIINKSRTPIDHEADLLFNDSIAVVLANAVSILDVM